MEGIKLTRRQIDNIIQGRKDMELICNEIAIAEKSGAKVDEELIKMKDYCTMRLERLFNHYCQGVCPEEKKDKSGRMVIDVKGSS